VAYQSHPPANNGQSYHHIKLNAHELSQIIPDIETIQAQMKYLIQKYAINRLIVTRGEQGAFVRTADNTWQSKKPAPQTNVIDTVGAGDALSSVFLLGQYKNWDIETTLERGKSARICQCDGRYPRRNNP